MDRKVAILGLCLGACATQPVTPGPLPAAASSSSTSPAASGSAAPLSAAASTEDDALTVREESRKWNKHFDDELAKAAALSQAGKYDEALAVAQAIETEARARKGGEVSADDAHLCVARYEERVRLAKEAQTSAAAARGLLESLIASHHGVDQSEYLNDSSDPRLASLLEVIVRDEAAARLLRPRNVKLVLKLDPGLSSIQASKFTSRAKEELQRVGLTPVQAGKGLDAVVLELSRVAPTTQEALGTTLTQCGYTGTGALVDPKGVQLLGSLRLDYKISGLTAQQCDDSATDRVGANLALELARAFVRTSRSGK